jgi:hypothetical protein
MTVVVVVDETTWGVEEAAELQPPKTPAAAAKAAASVMPQNKHKNKNEKNIVPLYAIDLRNGTAAAKIAVKIASMFARSFIRLTSATSSSMRCSTCL